MFLSSENYFKEIQNLVQSGSNLSLAVAFWGEGIESLITKSYQGQSLRLLCNLASGGTNPKVIRNLRDFSHENPGVQLRSMETLHAKLLLGEASAIIGSANFSANGLGLERSECATWVEAGYLVEDIQQIGSMQAWFDRIWEKSNHINEALLKKAEAQWLKNRASRPRTSTRFIETSSTELKNRNIAIAIYRLEASQQAQDEMTRIQAEAAQSDQIEISELDFFEDWPDDENDPKQSLPKDTPIIVVRYGKKGSVSVTHVARRIPQLDKVGSEGKCSMTILGIEKTVDGLKFTAADAKEFAKRIKPWVEHIYAGKEPDEAQWFPLDDFLDWEAGA